VTELLRLARAAGAFTLRRETIAESALDGVLAEEQVLVEVEAASVAGPELARAAGEGEPEPGIAAVGIVIAAGLGADHLVGQRVVCGPSIPCGECTRCRRGRPELCDARAPVGAAGGAALANRVVAGARWACPLVPPIEISGPEAALLPREASLAYTLYARANLAPGARVAILGRGALARLCLGVLAAQGIKAIAVAAGDDSWAEVARAAGAEVVRTEAAPEAEALRRALAASAPEGAANDPPDAIFETTGEPWARELALELAAPAGLALLVGRGVTGASGRQTAIDAAADAGVTVLGVAGPHPDLLPEVAALAARGELDLAAAAAVVTIDELPEVAGKLARGELPGRAAVATWRRG
jgi:threonine dehydrogenase-like Zn-dependent dehydrogenase